MNNKRYDLIKRLQSEYTPDKLGELLKEAWKEIEKLDSTICEIERTAMKAALGEE